jgi:tRNA A37 N6-isopentenylltransferase MiaA
LVYSNPATIGEAKTALKELENGKVPVIDNITSEVIKYGTDTSAKQVHQLINNIKTEGKVPVDWKKELIV